TRWPRDWSSDVCSSDLSMMNARAIKTDLGLDASAAIRRKHGATLDPYRACVGLAAAAADRGAVLSERSPVRQITFNRKIATVMKIGRASCRERVQSSVC